MFRRRFLQFISLATAGELATVCTAKASGTTTVTYRIKGFSCITCAVGLDVMLRRNKGILRSQSSYTDRTTTVDFNPNLMSSESVKALIAEMGFSADQ